MSVTPSSTGSCRRRPTVGRSDQGRYQRGCCIGTTIGNGEDPFARLTSPATHERLTEDQEIQEIHKTFAGATSAGPPFYHSARHYQRQCPGRGTCLLTS